MNFYGRYDFSNRLELINMEARIPELVQIGLITELTSTAELS